MDANKKHLSQIDQIQQLIEASRETIKLYETPYRKFIEDMEKNRRMIEQTLRPWKETQDLLSQISTSPALLSINQIVKDIQRQWDSLTRSLQNPILKINRLVEEWRRPIQLFQNNISLIANTYSKEFESLRNLALSPSIHYGTFIASTAAKLELPRIHNVTRTALQASIESAGFEIEAENQLVSKYPEVLLSELIGHLEEDSSPPIMNLFWIQREDLLWMIRRNPDIIKGNDLLINLPSSRYAYLARTICQKVVQINNASVAKGRQQIFKLTNRVVEALIALPMLLTIDRNTFGEFVDHLYFIIYEAAGEARVNDYRLEGGSFKFSSITN
jgi:hypothetical protein